jgi:hypothetical protein
MRIIKKNLFILFSFLFGHLPMIFAKTNSSVDSISQKGTWIYINQPLSLYNKLNLQLVYRPNLKHAYLADFSIFYIKSWLSAPVSNGFQFNGEYRYHIKPKPNSKFETFVYLKAGIGYVDITYSNGYDTLIQASYLNGGIGLGHTAYFSKKHKIGLQFNYGIPRHIFYNLRASNFSETEVIDGQYLLKYRPFWVVEFRVRLGFKF